MVAQIPDKLLLNDQELFIVAVNGSGLFDPASYGLTPAPAYKACWRGSLCQYAVCDGRLVLDDLKMSLTLPERLGVGPLACAGPAINGVQPSFDAEVWPPLNNCYEWLNLELPFTGGLLAAAGLVGEHYIQLGFQPAWQYRTVMELIFEAGTLRQARDVSDSVVALRAALAQTPLLPSPRFGEDSLRAWVTSLFQLHYNL